MINKVILVGNVGSTPEIRQAGDARVANFTLATSESYKDKNGVKQTITDWHRLTAWRGLVEIIEKYVKKGQQLYIEGRLKTRSYDDNGVKRYVTEIVVDTLKLLGSKHEEAGDAISPPPPPPSEDLNPAGNDDLPF